MRIPRVIKSFEDGLSAEQKAKIEELSAQRTCQADIDKCNAYLKSIGAPDGAMKVKYGESFFDGK